MREIKFRVWDNVDYMSKPFELKDIAKSIAFTSDCKVLQFTGLKDKNGLDIYEGDIVKLEWKNIELETGKIGDLTEIRVVEYKDGGFWLEKIPLYVHVDVEEENDIPWCEIIGNIYQNPEHGFK